MLFENVIKILTKAKDENIDLLVAREKLIANGYPSDEMTKAGDILRVYYKPIIKCWIAGNKDTINKICELYESNKTEELKALAEKIKGE